MIRGAAWRRSRALRYPDGFARTSTLVVHGKRRDDEAAMTTAIIDHESLFGRNVEPSPYYDLRWYCGVCLRVHSSDDWDAPTV